MKRQKSSQTSEIIWPMPLAAIISSLWANLILVIVSLFVASFIWILTAESSSEFSLALSIGVAFTLLSQFVTLQIGALTFGLAPLFVSVFILWVLKIAFVRALRGSLITQALHLLMLSLTFSMTHSAFWWVVSRFLTADIEVASGQLIISTSLVAFASSIWGMRSHKEIDEVEAQFETSIERTSRRVKERSARDILADIYATFHPDIRLGFRLGFRLVSALLIFGFINFIANALLNINSVRQVAAISAHDFGSWIVLIGLTLMYVPSVMLWIYSLSLGAGFTVGTGSLINLHTQAVGPLPSLPFLGFVPYDLPDWVAVSYLLAFLLSATVCFFNLRSVIVESFRRFFLALLLQVLLLNTIFSFIASGGIGSGRFEEVGVSLVPLLIWCALYTVLGLIGALVLISRIRGQESVEK